MTEIDILVMAAGIIAIWIFALLAIKKKRDDEYMRKWKAGKY